MVTYPGIGKRFCKQLLSIILDVELARIKIVPKKVAMIDQECLKSGQRMEETTKDNACNEMLTDIHKMVTKVKSDEEVSLEYMKIFEREKMIYEDGREDGFKNGQIIGYGNGFGDGLEKGIVALIADNLAFHVPIDKINVKLQKNFELTEAKAQEYTKKYLDAVSVSDKGDCKINCVLS
jgi:uncharacterized protein YfkK (UPF0435 family)